MKLYLICFIFIALAYGSTPDYFPRCKRSDPKIEKCVLKGIEAIKPRLKGGIPEINLPPLEPFKMDHILISTSVTGATVQAVVRNMTAHGGSDFKIEYLKIDLNNTYVCELKISFPHLQVSADYNTRGSRMLLFSVDGDGNFKGSFNNLAVLAKGIASPITRDGVEYLQLDSLTTQVTIGEGDLQVNPTGNTFTGRAASSLIGFSPSVVLKALSPVIDETTAPLVKQYLNDVLDTVPLNDFLVD